MDFTCDVGGLGVRILAVWQVPFGMLGGLHFGVLPIWSSALWFSDRLGFCGVLGCPRPKKIQPFRFLGVALRVIWNSL